MKFRFHTLDVFTDRKFGGNPLAVVLDADNLTPQQMQSVTREFNLSETTFVMQPADPAHTAKVRIFFPGGEMPFAGHPTLGTSILLADMLHASGSDYDCKITLELAAGLTPVHVQRRGDRRHGVLTAPVVPSMVATHLPTTHAMATALNLRVDDIGFDKHAIAVISGGPQFLYVPVTSRNALERSRVCEPYWSQLLSNLPNVDSAYLYARGGEGPESSFRARMYSPTGGIPEDPATGSATALLAAQLLTAEKFKDGEFRFNLEQGYEMGRPSNLELTMTVAGGKLQTVKVGGAAVHMMQGELEI